MENLKYIPFYLDWIELMRTKDTDEKKVAFFDAIVDYALQGTVPPAPISMNDPHGVDYARRDGYLVANKQLDYMIPKIKGGSSGKGISRNKGNQNARKQNRNNTGAGLQNNTETILLNKDKDKDKDNNNTPIGITNVSIYAHDEENPDSPVGNERPSCCPNDEEMHQMAAGINVPKDYISLFVETMSNHGWGYVNRQGNFVQLNRRNFKAVLRNFYDQHLKNKENDSKSKQQPIGVVHHDPNYEIRL